MEENDEMLDIVKIGMKCCLIFEWRCDAFKM